MPLSQTEPQSLPGVVGTPVAHQLCFCNRQSNFLGYSACSLAGVLYKIVVISDSDISFATYFDIGMYPSIYPYIC